MLSIDKFSKLAKEGVKNLLLAWVEERKWHKQLGVEELLGFASFEESLPDFLSRLVFGREADIERVGRKG